MEDGILRPGHWLAWADVISMNRLGNFLLITLLALFASGCASSSSSRRDVVLSDLIRDIEAQNSATASGQGQDRPDAPMKAVPTSASKPPTSTGAIPGARADDAPEGSYEPLDLSTGGGPLTIQAESVLRITVAEDPGLSGSYPVNGLGGIQLGYIGPVILDNLTEEEAAQKIQRVLSSREFSAATVTVKILRLSYDRVGIAGTVRKPGIIRVGAGDEISLNNALNQVSGITDTPWKTRVKVVRGGLTSVLAPYLPGEVYYLADEQRNPRIPNVMLRNNDAVFVYSTTQTSTGKRQGARWILVLGEVGQEGFVSFEPQDRFTMMNLIFRLGGLPAYANDKAVRVIRANADGMQQEFRVNVREILEEGDPALDFPLESGDRVIVPSRGISFF